VATDGRGRGLPGRVRRTDPPAGSSELAARLVPCAELDHLGALRCRHRRPVSSGRRAGALSGPALVRRPHARPAAAPAPAAPPPDSAVVGTEPSAHDQAPRAGRIYVAGGASLLAFCAALAVLDAERSSPDANIGDFGDAIWWAVTTMTTVGYGDHYPVTAAGRLVAFVLMIGGIALLGTVTRHWRPS
jgi:Ion channel